jgi:hypothetical protein
MPLEPMRLEKLLILALILQYRKVKLKDILSYIKGFSNINMLMSVMSFFMVHGMLYSKMEQQQSLTPG